MRSLKNKNAIMGILPIVILCSLIFTGCSRIEPDVVEETEVEQFGVPFFEMTREDLRVEPQEAKEIDISDQSLITISDGGDYILSGVTKGAIVISAEEQIVHLFLEGVELKSKGQPAICIESAGKVIITLVDGTENTFSDNGSYEDDEMDACIFGTCDLTINGTGKLNVSGYYKDAIHTKDLIKIKDAIVSCRSKRNGIHANDGAYILDSSCKVESEGMGIYTTKSGKNHKGSVEINNSVVNVISGKYAICSESDVVTEDSELNLEGVFGDVNAMRVIQVEE